MSNNNHSDILAAAVEYLLNQATPSHRSQAMELRLTKYVLPKLDETGKVSISQAEMTEMTGVTSPTIRRFNRDMVASGRWNVVAGGEGPTKTIYEPLFLTALLEVKKEVTSHDD